jgi:signal transduction histidine kinase
VRRKFLIDRSRQLRAAVLVVGLVLVLLIVVNVIFHALRTHETDTIVASAPALEGVMAEYDRNELMLVILASVVVLVGVFVVTIIETHRTAGAAFAIARQMTRVADGNWDARVGLRRGDNLRNLEEAFNDMAQSLRQQATEDVANLERLAGEIEAAQAGEAAARIAGELRELAAQKRDLVE